MCRDVDGEDGDVHDEDDDDDDDDDDDENNNKYLLGRYFWPYL